MLRALREVLPAQVVPARDADLLFYSVFGLKHASFVGTKVLFTGENSPPNLHEADFSIGHWFLDDSRFLRFPEFVSLALSDRSRGLEPPPNVSWDDRDFCLLLASNPTPERVAVFDALSRYRSVTSPGTVCHNTDAPDLDPRDGDWRRSKLPYQSRFRFSVAYENSAAPGYTTEKLCDALAAGTIPIYWGNPRVAEDVHPECFINASDFPSLDALVDHVAAVDRDPELAAAYLARRDYLVRPLDAYWDELVTFVAGLVESIPLQSRAAQRARAVRLIGRTTPTRVARSLKRLARRLGRRS